MTKIFITIPWFLPAFRAGGPIQTVANLVREYNENVEYFIFCGDTDVNGAVLENVSVDEWQPFNPHTQVWYCSPEKISDTLVKQVEATKPDIILMIGLFSWHFNIVPMLFCKGPKKILSSRGMLHPGALSQKKWKKRIYLQLFKLLEYHYKVHFHATDADEQKFISDYFGPVAQVTIAGNFPNKIGELPTQVKETGVLKLVTVALISPMKNILKVLEALERCEYRIEYNIYGAVKDEEYWQLCKDKIKQLPKNIGVEWHKEIEPSQVKEALASNHVFILPSKSENFGHAIYEALSAGRPVITSNHTPWNGLKESHAGINVSIDKPEEMINAIRFFAEMEEVQMERWSEGAYVYSEDAVDVAKIKEEYHTLFNMQFITDKH